MRTWRFYREMFGDWKRRVWDRGEESCRIRIPSSHVHISISYLLMAFVCLRYRLRSNSFLGGILKSTHPVYGNHETNTHMNRSSKLSTREKYGVDGSRWARTKSGLSRMVNSSSRFPLRAASAPACCVGDRGPGCPARARSTAWPGRSSSSHCGGCVAGAGGANWESIPFCHFGFQNGSHREACYRSWLRFELGRKHGANRSVYFNISAQKCTKVFCTFLYIFLVLVSLLDFFFFFLLYSFLLYCEFLSFSF